MINKLTKEDIYFLARVKKIEVEQLLRVQDILDPKRVREVLIRYEYRERGKIRKIAKSEIVALLMYRYNVSRSYIESIIYKKNKQPRKKECINCGSTVSYYMWCKGNGFCKNCLNALLNE